MKIDINKIKITPEKFGLELFSTLISDLELGMSKLSMFSIDKV